MSEIRLARQNVAGSTEVPRRIDSELLVRGATQHADVAVDLSVSLSPRLILED